MMTWLPTLAGLVIIQRFTNQPKLDLGASADVSGNFSERLPVSGRRLPGLVVDEKPDGGGGGQPRGGVILFILAYMAQVLPDAATAQTEVLYYFNLFKHMEDFTRGVVDTRTVIFYASATFPVPVPDAARGGEPPVEMT